MAKAPQASTPVVSNPKVQAPHITAAWTQYKASACERARNLLLENYLPIVRYNAERIRVKLPAEVELDDLVSAGIFGLMDALAAFDLNRGVKFETYCATRIRGAILDELRSMDWVPRLVRSRAHKLNAVNKQLEAELGRAATDTELAGRMGVSMVEFERIARDAAAVGLVSLSRTRGDNDGDKSQSEIDLLEDPRATDPFRQVQRDDLRELITKGLTRAERLIIILYYFEEMTMKDIGATLDLSESRVSQMHSSILARLKARMIHRNQELTQAAAA